jgi:hypothetical protein
MRQSYFVSFKTTKAPGAEDSQDIVIAFKNAVMQPGQGASPTRRSGSPNRGSKRRRSNLGLDSPPGAPAGSHLIGFVEPTEGLVLLAQPCIQNREEVGNNVFPLRLLPQVSHKSPE